ncbi:MAG: DUF4249 family protein [Ignavibacteria bacterium]|jgi:hypothetical protein|nr:DUF4249 family protein [Ignavibacteria bacterium]MCU7520758.1 DUF4249 family protein [Ignavibacteria bacterium]
MKKILLSMIVITAAFLSPGCKDEDFSPKGDFKEKYILNCVLKSDTTVQTLTLSSSYNVDGYDPLANRTDPALRGADVRVWVGDSVYIFREAEESRSDTSRYSTPIRYYYAKNFRPQANKPAEILAVLPNGRKLHAATSIPLPVYVNFAEIDSIIPIDGRSYFRAVWNTNSGQNTYYYPRPSLVYFKFENGIPIRHVRYLPERYILSGGKFVPVYPSPTLNLVCTVELDALNRVMEEISAGDPNKKNYVVLSVIFEVWTLDMSLSGYYSSCKLADDGFSVKLDQTDFTNVEGGLGIFGSCVSYQFPMRLDKNYISSFGYKTKLGAE